MGDCKTNPSKLQHVRFRLPFYMCSLGKVQLYLLSKGHVLFTIV